VYISAKTPFLSAVKRVERLLHLADKRLVQSATTLAKADKGHAHRKRKRGGEEDEILDIAETVEHLKKKGRKAGTAKGDEGEGGGEEVVLKATGKAIQKCLELGLWFQQREEYAVRLVTGSVGAIDDIAVEEELGDAVESDVGEDDAQDPSAMNVDEDTAAGADDDADVEMDVNPGQVSDHLNRDKGYGTGGKQPSGADRVEGGRVDIPESRLRYTSSLEVYVRLR
jgi:ribonuclease P/MRP protein subunit POP7